MNFPTAILTAAIAVAFFFALRSSLKRKNRGCGGCDRCSDTCHKDSKCMDGETKCVNCSREEDMVG